MAVAQFFALQATAALLAEDLVAAKTAVTNAANQLLTGLALLASVGSGQAALAIASATTANAFAAAAVALAVWTRMDLPGSCETFITPAVGGPTCAAGASSAWPAGHKLLSIVASPLISTVVYLGGTAQPQGGTIAKPTPELDRRERLQRAALPLRLGGERVRAAPAAR